jgi:hypothetical protein
MATPSCLTASKQPEQLPNAPAANPFIKRPEYRKGWEGILKI